jgi:pyruvate/2-oxoglutarate dehydrogenase complex dihydrolipoamide acyltransferase (E2) component
MNQLKSGYKITPLSFQRKMVAASIAPGRRQNNIQALIEVDITVPRLLIRQHKERTGESLSLTAYVTSCLAQTVSEHAQVNTFIKGNKLVQLEDVAISVMLEREVDGESVPEPIGIRAAQNKTYRQILAEIRAAQQMEDAEFGGLNDMTWIKHIPGFLLKTFVRLASRNIAIMSRYGVIGITSVGMYAPKDQALWVVPLVAGATVEVAVGSIVNRPHLLEGKLENREHLCLTVVFNHDIVDGGPVVRFLKSFAGLLQSGSQISGAIITNPEPDI